MGIAALAVVISGCGDDLPPPPPQPIAFNHQAHFENDIGCLECHEGAATLAEAGLPPMAACATCHRRRAAPDHPEVLKFMAQYDNGNGEPMVWRKVNYFDDADMVQFKHKPHTQAGVDCTECHGEVSQMTVAQATVEVARMGWCIGCHEEQGASVDCLTCHH